MSTDPDEPAPVALLGLLRDDDAPVPPGLTDRVLHGLRSRRRGDDGRLEVAPGVRVRTRVVVDVARAAGQAVGAVVVGAVLDDDGVLALRLVVDGTEPLPDLARRLRRSVRSALRTTGLSGVVARVDLTAVDLVPAPAQLLASGGVQQGEGRDQARTP